jgi:hypothetical protein
MPWLMFLCIPLLDYILPLMLPDAYILMGGHHLQQCCYINLERLRCKSYLDNYRTCSLLPFFFILLNRKLKLYMTLQRIYICKQFKLGQVLAEKS